MSVPATVLGGNKTSLVGEENPTPNQSHQT
jgi:hypothetical protein